MIIQTVKYEDFNGNTVKKDFAFHLSKAEVSELKFREDGSDLVDVMRQITEEEDIRGILDMFKEIIRAAVGKRSEDGTRFTKTEDARSELFDTDAYSELLFTMLDKPDFAAKFITGMLPKDMQKDLKDSPVKQDMSKEELLSKLKELEGQNTQNK